MLALQPLPAFSDNYIWLFGDGQQAWVVDPGDAAPVLSALDSQSLTLAGILLTHHHADHSAGIAALRARHAVPVYGAANSAVPELVTDPVQAGDTLTLGNITFTVLAIPGHTLDHIAFHSAGARVLFCGDTLFSGGCGRVFEGTYPQMYAALQQLAALPDDTRVCCAHEYTLSNLQFGLLAEPANRELHEHWEHCKRLRDNHQPTLPSTLAQEKRINVFLRAADAEQFAALREWKNRA